VNKQEQSLASSNQGIDINILIRTVGIATARAPKHRRNRKLVVEDKHIARTFYTGDWGRTTQRRFRACCQFFN
jgi:hypothetical protein